MLHTAAIATLVCLASWVGLAVGAGNIGLQRTISMGPTALLDSPAAIVLSVALAFVVSVSLTGATGRPDRPWGVFGAVLVGDAIGALFIAPVAVGELEIWNAPVVFVVLATFGLQPLAAALGARTRSRHAST